MHIRAVFVVLLIGILLLPLTPQNITRTAKSTKAQNSSFLSMYENVTTHQGDLIINGTQSFVIENCTYIQNGSISVKDSASLSLRNALLTIVAQYGTQYVVNNIYADDYATIRVDSSKVTNGSLVLNGYANASIKHSSLDDVGIVSWGNSQATIENSTFQELFLQEASQVSLKNSRATWLVDLTFDFPQVVHLNGLKAGYQEYWNLHQNQTVQDVLYDLTLEDSVVAWGLLISEGTVVEILNCEIERMGIELHDMTEIKNAKPGYNEEFVFKSIVLRKSYVSGWHVMVFGTQVTIENCEIRVSASGNSNISIVKSLIDMITAVPDSSITITLDAAILIDYLTIIDCDVYACGNATFSINNLTFVSSNFTRSYNIVAEDRSGNPMENVELALFDKNNKAFWTGFTDNCGKADFNLTFTDGNYTDALRLEAVKGNLSATKSISFLSDTPVTMVLGLHDIAMIRVAPAKTVVGQGHNLDTNFTVANLGDLAETFYATIYANATNMGTYAVYNLANGTSTTLAIACSTTGLAYGNYTISANTQPVPGENSTANNNYTYSIPVHVGVPGDISGPTQGVYDGKVDMRDISYLVLRFNSKPDSANWNANVDINNDGTVNMRDISIAIINFNKHE